MPLNGPIHRNAQEWIAESRNIPMEVGNACKSVTVCNVDGLSMSQTDVYGTIIAQTGGYVNGCGGFPLAAPGPGRTFQSCLCEPTPARMIRGVGSPARTDQFIFFAWASMATFPSRLARASNFCPTSSTASQEPNRECILAYEV